MIMGTATGTALRRETSACSGRLGARCLRVALRWCAVAAGLAGLGGCGSTEASCSAILSPAVLVTVVDASGSAVCDVTVHIQGSEDDVQKDLTRDSCYAAGGEQAGDYTVTVSRGDSELATQSVHVGSGKCGATQEKVVVHLPAP
jgi:hypothetical protein